MPNPEAPKQQSAGEIWEKLEADDRTYHIAEHECEVPVVLQPEARPSEVAPPTPQG